MSDNALSRRLQRVFSMSGDEFVSRSRQELGKRIDGVLSRVGNDFSETPRISGSIPRFLFRSEEVPDILSLLRQRLPDEYNRIITRAERICVYRFDLLGYENLDYGEEIDWHLDRVHGKRAPRKMFYKMRYLDFAECGDVKVTWELNRHQHFLTLAKAYRMTGQQRFADEIFAQWEHWHRENSYPYGVNWASSLEVAFRSLSWLWTYYLLGDVATQHAGFREEFLRSISVHGRCIERYIATYFSPNTHLLGEAVALLFIGVLCPELPSAERWKNLGWQVTLQEAHRQVRPDGLHFEQSLYYHVYAIDLFLHARVLAARNELPIPADHDATLERMLNALTVLGRSGFVPRIGDDDGGRLFDGRRNRTEHMLDPLATGAVIFRRGDFKAVADGLREETLWLLGTNGAREFDSIPAQQPEKAAVAFAETGLYVMNAADRQIVIDAGPHGAGSGGHGHADALSICVSDNNGPILIDRGTFEYVGGGPERDQFRGTSAHNTLTIDGATQPEPRGPFAWSHHPKSVAEKWINGEYFDFFAGSHDAYENLSSPATHRRHLFSLKSGFWLVRDVIEGEGEHELDAYWHLGPQHAESHGHFISKSGGVLDVFMPEGSNWSRTIESGSWSPAYGRAEPAPVLHFSTVARLPVESITLFRSTQNASAPIGTLTAVGQNSSARAYFYQAGDEEHWIFFATPGQRWALGNWSSDAEFLYWGYDRKQDRGMLILCGGTQVSFGGHEIISIAGPVCYIEVLRESGTVRLLGADQNAIIVRDPGLRSLITNESALTMPVAQQARI